MHRRSTQLFALAAITSTATAISLPQAASARLMYDRGQAAAASSPVTSGDGHDLTLPLAGITFAVVLTGAGAMRLRMTRPRPAPRQLAS